MAKSSPTVRQLAALAGVSRTTVSLALRNHPSISCETRERVRKLADEEGYALDPVYARLMGHLRVRRAERPPEKIAFLTTSPDNDQWLRASYNDRNYYQGACARAAKLGYEIEVFWAKEPGMTARRMSKILHTRSIRGVIILPLPRSHGHFSLDWQHFSSVTLCHTLFKPRLHRVAHFHSEGMLLALRRLRQHGYRRIGYANLLDEDTRSHNHWLAAFLAYQRIYVPKERVTPFLPKAWKTEQFHKWIKDGRIDAVLSNVPMILEAASQAGPLLGRELGVASLDVQPDGHGTAYAGVDQQPRVQGATAVDIVVADVQNNEFGLPSHPRVTQLDGVWLDGPSIRRRKVDQGHGKERAAE